MPSSYAKEKEKKGGGGIQFFFTDRICRYMQNGGMFVVCAQYLYLGIKFEEHVYQKAKAMKSVEWNSVSMKRSCDDFVLYEKG